jgi:hypothetical protein
MDFLEDILQDIFSIGRVGDPAGNKMLERLTKICPDLLGSNCHLGLLV